MAAVLARALGVISAWLSSRDYFNTALGVWIEPIGHAGQYWGKAAEKDYLTRYANGSTTVLPQRGDILAYTGYTYGHVGIVKSVGGGKVTMCDQNRINTSACADLSMSVNGDTGTVTVSSFSSGYTLQGWIRGVVNGKPVSPPDGSDPTDDGSGDSGGGSGGSDSGSTQPEPGFTLPGVSKDRAYAPGAGKLHGMLYELAMHDAGGPVNVGVPIWSGWLDGYVWEIYRRVSDGKLSAIIADEGNKAARYFMLRGDWLAYYVDQGGPDVFGAPISNAYALSAPGAWRVDFQKKYMVYDSNGFHVFNYPHGYTPGQGAADPTPFQVAYGELGGDAVLGNPISPVYGTAGYQYQIYQKRDGGQGRLYLSPNAPVAHWITGSALTAYLNAGHVHSCGGLASSLHDAGNGQKRVHARFCSILVSAGGSAHLSHAGSGQRFMAPGEGASRSEGIALRNAYERNGGVARLGVCGQKLSGLGYRYQYCDGGAAGRNLLAYDYDSAAPSAMVVLGGVFNHYTGNGGLGGLYGVPEGDAYAASNGKAIQNFFYRAIEWYSYAPHDTFPAYKIGQGSDMRHQFQAGKIFDPDIGYATTPIYTWSGTYHGQAHMQNFQGGKYNGTSTLILHEGQRSPRAYQLVGGVRAKYLQLGGPDGLLGLPVTDAVTVGNNVWQFFQHGYITGSTVSAVYRNYSY